MDSRSSKMKFYILGLYTFQLLVSIPFGLCGRAKIDQNIGLHKTLRLLQIDESSTSPQNSFPYGTYTSPPPLSTTMPPTPQNSPNPYGILTSPPPTPIKAMPPPLLSVSPRPPPSPSTTIPPPNSHPSPQPPSPSAIIPPPNSHSLRPPPSPSSTISPPNSPSSPSPPPAPYKKPENAVWCVAKPTVPSDLIQQALDYACGSGAGCEAIQPNGVCYQPTTLLSHASYAFNSYWQKKKQGGGTCDFGGTAMLVTVDPSYNQCHFIYS